MLCDSKWQSRSPGPNQFCYRLTMAWNHDGFALFDKLRQTRKLGLCLVYIRAA
jgi:hypothetical protein